MALDLQSRTAKHGVGWVYAYPKISHGGISSTFNNLPKRGEYRETRVRALGFISQRLYALVFKETSFGIRVISLRKANMREVRFYEQKTAQQKHH
ncbi:MAG: BrnT family toxin [Pusillimonas sp.]|nr:BrnT family toxin [Pusillimonas sp.]